MMSRRAPFLIALALAGAPALSSPPAHPQVDALFSKWDSPRSPGCSLLVLQNGTRLYERGYGMADLEHDVPITSKTVFHVASISKQFTAASVVLLAQEGKLSLDDDVRKYVPELPDYGSRITLRELIHHTSGLRDQWELLKWAGWRFPDDVITDDDVMRIVVRQRSLNFPPGTEYAYSNTGYTLLAHVVKRVSGESLRAFTTRRIFEPLAMHSTYFRDNHAEIAANIAFGYEKAGDAYRLSSPQFDTVGPSSLLTTVDDLARWDENFYAPRVGGPALIEQLLQPGALTNGKAIDYAFGLEVATYRGLRTVEHSGRDAGYRSDILRFPDQHFTVICLCNTPELVTRDVSRKVADVFLASELQPAATSADKTDTSPKYVPAASALASYAGQYHSDEVDATYEIIATRDGLVMRSNKLAATPLRPVAPDLFEMSLGQVAFVRAARGEVSHFVVATDEGITALRFSRLPALGAPQAHSSGNSRSKIAQ